jgi:hypothetical protein
MGKGKKTNVQDEVTSTVLDEVSQPKLASKRSTKWDTSHLCVTEECVTMDPVVVDFIDDADVFIDETLFSLK